MTNRSNRFNLRPRLPLPLEDGSIIIMVLPEPIPLHLMHFPYINFPVSVYDLPLHEFILREETTKGCSIAEMKITFSVFLEVRVNLPTIDISVSVADLNLASHVIVVPFGLNRAVGSTIDSLSRLLTVIKRTHKDISSDLLQCPCPFPLSFHPVAFVYGTVFIYALSVAMSLVVLEVSIIFNLAVEPALLLLAVLKLSEKVLVITPQIKPLTVE